jgi:HTH-type transcriptional regulator, sugar sensing transcriptional regulator
LKKFESFLKKIGLSEKEAVLYMAILTHGPSSKSDMVLRTNLHRPEVYRYLPLLIERGLVSLVSTGKRALYVAESPELLVSLLETLESEMSHMLPDLLSLHAR